MSIIKSTTKTEVEANVSAAWSNLVSDAATALDYFTEDELEAYCDEQRVLAKNFPSEMDIATDA